MPSPRTTFNSSSTNRKSRARTSSKPRPKRAVVVHQQEVAGADFLEAEAEAGRPHGAGRIAPGRDLPRQPRGVFLGRQHAGGQRQLLADRPVGLRQVLLHRRRRPLLKVRLGLVSGLVAVRSLQRAVRHRIPPHAIAAPWRRRARATVALRRYRAKVQPIVARPRRLEFMRFYILSNVPEPNESRSRTPLTLSISLMNAPKYSLRQWSLLPSHEDLIWQGIAASYGGVGACRLPLGHERDPSRSLSGELWSYATSQEQSPGFTDTLT